MGFTTIPIKTPNRIHALFSGNSKRGLEMLIIKKDVEIKIKVTQAELDSIKKKYIAKHRAIDPKKRPNFLFDGRIASINFTFFYLRTTLTVFFYVFFIITHLQKRNKDYNWKMQYKIIYLIN